MWEDCLESVGRLSEGCEKSVGYGNDVWRVSEGCLEGVGRLSRLCGKAICMVWEGSLEGVGGYLQGVVMLEDVGRKSRGCQKSG